MIVIVIISLIISVTISCPTMRKIYCEAFCFQICNIKVKECFTGCCCVAVTPAAEAYKLWETELKLSHKIIVIFKSLTVANE